MNWGKVPLGSVLPFIFDSFSGSTGASITLTGLALADILIYKGTSMVQRASTAGFVLLDTDGIDIDTITGIHGFSIDTGDNTDAGFFVAGSFYTVVVASVTIDAQTVNFVAGTFWLGPTLSVAGVDEVDVTYVAGTLQTAGDLATMITAVDNFVDTEIADIQGRLPAALTANGNMKCSLMEILTTALTETAGQIAAAFKQFFDVASPTGTMKAITWNPAWDAEVQSEVEDGLVTHRLDELLNADSDIDGAAPPTVGSVFHELMSKTAGSFTFDQTTDSNEAIRDKETDIETDTAEIGVAGAGLTGIAVGVGGIQATSFAAGAIDAASLAADATTELTAGIRIKKNTALSNFPFLMVDSTDHITPKTGLTITATRSIDGAAFAACANAATEVANGFYKINLANTDLNGDTIALKFTGGATADDRLLTIITTV